MTTTKNDIISDHSACPSLDRMVQYKEGLLGEHDSHVVEKHVLECSMCQEVMEYVQPENVAAIGALAASIDERVDERTAGGGSGFNFNRYMAVAASFVGFLMIIGNLLTTSDVALDNTVVHETEKSVEGKPEETVESEKEMFTDEDVKPEEEVEESKADSVEVIGERLALDITDPVNEGISESGDSDELSGTIENSAEYTEPVTTDNGKDVAETYLMASVDLLIVEAIEQNQSNKGSTDKKVGRSKIKGLKSYAPEFDDDDGYPLYSGGDKKLREDIVKKINGLHLALGEGGEVGIWITVAANGTVGPIEVDEKISDVLANQIKGALSKLPPWVPGNVKIKYTLKIQLH